MIFCHEVAEFSMLQSFWLKIVSLCALHVPGPVKNYCCKIFSNKFPAHVKCLLILLLLSCDITFNLGLINFGFVNCRSIRNKDPLIGDTIISNNLDLLGLAETHIQNSDTNSLLKSITPLRF